MSSSNEMIISPTVEQFANALAANGYPADLIETLCAIYTDDDLKNKALAPGGMLWDCDDSGKPTHKHVKSANLWAKMRAEADARFAAMDAGVNFDHLPGMPWIGEVPE